MMRFPYSCTTHLSLMSSTKHTHISDKSFSSFIPIIEDFMVDCPSSIVYAAVIFLKPMHNNLILPSSVLTMFIIFTTSSFWVLK